MAQTATPTKVVLLTGYLGAGKTTIVNHILSNDEGIRAAVIVNDIGEVNVDASLIAAGGLSEVDGDLIPLTNGCICCTLADDLSRQFGELAARRDVDYVIIEASGICEPIPIAYTISAFCQQTAEGPAPLALDNIVAVVDCARMYDEFAGGRDLLRDDMGEDDLEALLVQQIEFCSTLVLNKADLVTPGQLAELRTLVRALQRDAVVVEAAHGQVDLGELLDTGRFDFDRAYGSAAWQDAMEHPEEHEDPEVLEYGIQTFVYERRRPFDVDALSALVATWPKSVIRAKGLVWLAQDPDMSYVFEQAGSQVSLTENGLFVASAPDEERRRMLDESPELGRDWDPVCGDRLTRVCLIGQRMDREALVAGLDACLADWEPQG